MTLDAQTQSLYLVVKGIYSWTSQENWQYGIRLIPAHGFTAPEGIVDFSDWDTNEATVSRTESGWTITSEWTLDASPGSFNADDYLNDQCAPAFLDFFGAGVSNQCKIESLTLYPIKGDGKVNGGRKAVLTYVGTLPQGIDSSNQMPMEDAVCVSWGTAQVGPKGRGRIYSPPPGTSAVDSHGFLTSTKQDDLRDGYVSILEGLSLSVGVGSGWFIRPVVTGKPWHQGAVIDSVRVGNVVDRQASRRRQIPETYNTPGTTSY